MYWGIRFNLWMEQRTKWRNLLDYTKPETIEMLKLELMLNG